MHDTKMKEILVVVGVAQARFFCDAGAGRIPLLMQSIQTCAINHNNTVKHQSPRPLRRLN